MIFRTYGRRTRCDARSLSNASLLDADGGIADDCDLRELPLSQESYQDRRHGVVPSFSSQESSPCSFDPDLFTSVIRESQEPFNTPLLSDGEADAGRPGNKGHNVNRGSSGELKGLKLAAAVSETSTLLEAQEFGEMMEHVDEVNFSLDGLKPWHPARIRRSSLLSLLQICSMPQQRRLLRARGLSNMIIDAILGLNYDDAVSTVAAATILYVLASDVEDEFLLDSPACVRFLLMLLNPPTYHTAEKKQQKTGSNLLEIRKPLTLNSAIKGVDSSSGAIISKVKEILLNCNEITSDVEGNDGFKRPELSSKWIALLTMEKACLSTVSFEDTSEIMAKTRGNFKEILRDLKGLDAIFDVIATCHSALEGWFNNKPKDGDSAVLENVLLLLKCLKIMENATFMSTENQNYLLGMEAKLESAGLPLTFVGTIISCIKLLSGLSLLQNISSNSHGEKLRFSSNGIASVLKEKHTDCCGNANFGVEPSVDGCKRLKLSTSNMELSTSGSEGLSAMDRPDCSASTSYSVELHRSNGESCTSNTGLRVKSNGVKLSSSRRSSGWISIRSISSSSPCQSRRTEMSKNSKGESEIDPSDPFAFDEDHLGPSKWEQLSSKKGETKSCRQVLPDKKHVNGSEIPIVIIDEESSQPSSGGKLQFCDKSCASVDEISSLLDDCLLTSVKVLMNLTNDNTIGCQQIGACGGIDILASLISNHFPSFNMHLPIGTENEESMQSLDRSTKLESISEGQLNDRELDFLVAILGLLVNLVEKDSLNRLRLASARVVVDRSETTASNEIYKDVVPLLCAIFVSNQGAGNASGNEELLASEDEASLLQGQREAEMMIIEAYTALLLAFLSTESASVKEAIARCLPSRKLQILVPVLERFVAFHLTLNMISPETHSTVVKVIESCKDP
ncbi:hypothetical protein HPP92_014533 [Vanilla planifolia]|uniref:WAPL domain-containing protein n=1 Tax=Vanilla planifolia TaxID=51239 RepID=A0A835UUY1_VANPL|nr:hypothetical protein HPP92_014533 [Vanilla planifolia]